MDTPSDDYPRRPPRLRCVHDRTPLYFVTLCTFGRQPILASTSVHESFLVSADKVMAAGNAVGRFVIMPDHIHLFLRIGPQGKLGLAVKCLKEGITKRLRKERLQIQVWQPGFFDHLLRSSESYAGKWAYVGQNPVRAGLVSKAADWPYQGEVTPLTPGL